MRLLAGLTFMYVGTWMFGIFVVLLFLVRRRKESQCSRNATCRQLQVQDNEFRTMVSGDGLGNKED